MENVKTQVTNIEAKNLFQKVVFSTLKRFDQGLLQLTLPNGDVHLIGNGRGLKVDLHIHNNDFYKKFVLYGDVGFGESFCDGDWTSSNVRDLVRWAILNLENSGIMSGSKVKDFGVNLMSKVNHIGHLLKKNSKKGSVENISYHYDLSNDFYKLMLDETMSYSCGIFENNETSLYDAQVKKLDTICDKLDIQDGDHILEVGCGWAGLATHIAKRYDCKITGVTISKEQYNFAVDRVKKEGLEDKVTILLKDYRDIDGQFEKIVSIEMIEAVGDEFLPEYFETLDKLLKPDGAIVIQAITSPDSRYESFKKGVDFIQKHIFPGSLLPSVTAMNKACSKTSLQLHNLEDIGIHYAKTLNLWDKAVDEKKDEISELGMDEKFFKKWKYYLNYCEAAFMERNISDIIVTYLKPNNTKYKNRLRE